ncbi:MAG TPA: hypothetical protein VFP56_12320, partial [Candidatus Limnocylindrales bacterium]|nr:hypothetical protein [Candidatus Limnocylindrales bacterium]
DPDARTVAVRVRDRFGDYGLVGFAAVTDGVVEQLAFSCRILGMGVERAVYEWLGTPAIEVAEPVSAPLQGERPDWLRIVEGPAGPPAEAASGAAGGSPGQPGPPGRAELLFVGGCDLESVLPFLGDPDAVARHFNYSPAETPRLIVHRDSIDYLLADELPEAARTAILADAPFLDAEALVPPAWAGFREIVYSPLIDYVQAKYARPDLPGVYVSFGDVEQPNLDAAKISSLAKRYGLDPVRLEAFAQRWQVVRKPDEVWREQLRRLFSRIPADARLTVLLGATDAFGLDPERLETHRHHNALVSGVAAEFPNVATLAVDPLLHGREDFTNSIRHYSRRVYHDLARELSARLGTSAAVVLPEAAAAPGRKEARKPIATRRAPVSAARRLLRRGLRRLRDVTGPRERT